MIEHLRCGSGAAGVSPWPSSLRRVPRRSPSGVRRPTASGRPTAAILAARSTRRWIRSTGPTSATWRSPGAGCRPDAFLSIDTPDGGEWWADSRLIFEELLRRDPDRWRDAQPPYITNLKATPLMVGGRLFINMPTSQAASIDAATGETLWVYNPKTYEEGTTTMTARWNQRGVAYWSDGPEREDERILFGTGNGYLICVDAKTGRPCSDFGEDGWIDLTEGLPRADRSDRDWLNALLYSVQSPPLVVGDTIVTPSSISSYNITREAPPGWMRGFDVRTGSMKWMFHTIPQGDEFGNDTWEGDSWRVTGKVGVWSFMSADPELGLLYLPTNTPAPDYYGGHRLGDNLFAESVVALDIETGQREWHFQAVHHGLWDWDFPAAPNLVDVVVDGRPVKALAQVSKQGFLYAFNRETGEPIWPIEERPVATDTDVPGERPSPTQPFPTKPAPFEYQGAVIDDLVDFTPENPPDGHRGGPGLPARTDLLAADVGRNRPAAERRRRRQLVGRGRRSGDRHPVRALEQRLLGDAVPRAGSRRRGHAGRHRAARSDPHAAADAAGAAALQATLLAHDGHRPQHRRPPSG